MEPYKFKSYILNLSNPNEMYDFIIVLRTLVSRVTEFHNLIDLDNYNDIADIIDLFYITDFINTNSTLPLALLTYSDPFIPNRYIAPESRLQKLITSRLRLYNECFNYYRLYSNDPTIMNGMKPLNYNKEIKKWKLKTQ